MTHKIGAITFGSIKNVRKSGDEDGLYFADVEISEADGFPMETHFYCARYDDYALTGRWVYQQIIDGNFDGEIVQLESGVDPFTGLPVSNVSEQIPTVDGAQVL